MIHSRFSPLALRAGLITREQLKSALHEQAETGELLGSILYCRKILSEEQVVKLLSRIYGIPGVLISKFNPDSRLAAIVPKPIAEKYEILPLKMEQKVLYIAAVDPQDWRMAQEVEFLSGHDVVVYVAMRFELLRKIQMFYDQAVDEIALPDYVSEAGDSMVLTTTAECQPPNVDQELLDKNLDHALKHGPPPVAHAPSPKPTKTTQTILVGDGDAHIRFLLKSALIDRKYDVLCVGSGRQAVQQIQASQPDLIVMDAILPGVNGFTICRKLKGSKRYAHTPVVMLTTVDVGERFLLDMKEQYGADQILVKPFNLNDLLATVERLLDGQEDSEGGSIEHHASMIARAEDLMEKGLTEFGSEKFDDAAECFRKAIAIDRFHPRLHYYLGKTQEIHNDFYGAIVSYEKAIRLDPHFFPAVKDLAILYQNHGFRRKAIEMWERAIEVCPQEGLRQKLKEQLFALL